MESRAEINETEMKKAIEKINEVKKKTTMNLMGESLKFLSQNGKKQKKKKKKEEEK